MKSLLATLYIVLSVQVFAQIQLSLQNMADIESVCESFLQESHSFVGDIEYSDSTLKTVCTESLLALLTLNQQEVYLLDAQLREGLHDIIGIANVDTMLACAVSRNFRTFFLTVEPSENTWKVSTFDNEHVTPETLEKRQLNIDSLKIIHKEKDMLKKMAIELVDYMNELNYSDSSANLKRITNENVYKYFVLTSNIWETRHSKSKDDCKFYEIRSSEFFAPDSAVVYLSVKHGDDYIINCKKIDGKWMVNGLGSTVTNEEISELEQNLESLVEAKKIHKVLEEFNISLELFLTNNDGTLSEAITSPEINSFFTLVKQKFYGWDSKFINVRGFSTLWLLSNIEIKGEKATAKQNNLIMNFGLFDGQWKIIGFNDLIGNDLTIRNLELMCDEIWRAFGIYYFESLGSDYGGGYDQTVEIDFSYLEDVDLKEENLTIYSSFQWRLNKPSYILGTENLVEFFDFLDDPITENKICFVRFIIEKNGEISEIEVITPGVDPAVTNKILNHLKGMEKWIPAELNDEVVRCQLVVGFNI